MSPPHKPYPKSPARVDDSKRVEAEETKRLVHALYARDAAPGAFDEMDRRVRIAVDGKKKK